MLLATDLADALVKTGVPFRTAHELVGKAVAESVKSGVPLDAIDRTMIDPAYTTAMRFVFSLEIALAARTHLGASSVANVKREADRWKASL